MSMWHQFFTFLNTGRYEFLYDILSFSRSRRCSGLIRYGILYVTSSRQGDDNATALAETALPECSC